MSDMQPSYLYWCVGLVIAVPIIIVFLNECIDRSRRGTGYYSDVLILLRDAVLPLLVLVILVRFVFSVSGDNLSESRVESSVPVATLQQTGEAWSLTCSCDCRRTQSWVISSFT